MPTTDRLLYIGNDGRVRQLGFDPAATDWAGGGGGGGGTGTGITFAETPPSFPHTNLLWWNTASGTLHVQYSDAWVVALNVRNGTDGAQGPSGSNGADGVATLAQMHAAMLSF